MPIELQTGQPSQDHPCKAAPEKLDHKNDHDDQADHDVETVYPNEGEVRG